MRAALSFLAMWATGSAALAQNRGFEVAYGAWDGGARAAIWRAGATSALLGSLDYGVSVIHLDDHRSAFDRTQTGGEFSLGFGRLRSGLYLVAGAGLSMKHGDGNVDAEWSTGAGYGTRILSVLGVGIEVGYRAEDQFSRGFWQLDPSDRRGWMALGKVSLNLGGPRARRPSGDVPSRRNMERSAKRNGVDRNVLAADVVGTALDAMGTPYRWGGDGANGYDCSGLIQFAYGEHGISLPRTSREQAAFGRPVERDVSGLAPGDILGFSVEGDRVTHVGLYVGNGQFIHSASSGVRLSSLTGRDPDSLWWQQRWAATRRVL